MRSNSPLRRGHTTYNPLLSSNRSRLSCSRLLTFWSCQSSTMMDEHAFRTCTGSSGSSHHPRTSPPSGVLCAPRNIRPPNDSALRQFDVLGSVSSGRGVEGDGVSGGDGRPLAVTVVLIVSAPTTAGRAGVERFAGWLVHGADGCCCCCGGRWLGITPSWVGSPSSSSSGDVSCWISRVSSSSKGASRRRYRSTLGTGLKDSEDGERPSEEIMTDAASIVSVSTSPDSPFWSPVCSGDMASSILNRRLGSDGK
jgi:hypothetical protein